MSFILAWDDLLSVYLEQTKLDIPGSRLQGARQIERK